MQALVHDPQAPAALRRVELPDPVPAPDQVLIDVHAVALNRLDLDYPDSVYGPGGVPGVDAAGTVVVPAADGSGPAVGSRVATFAIGGAFATQRAVPARDVGVLPGGVTFVGGAALPGAGVTALQALRRFGTLLGRRLLVTGAAGGVGRFAVQLGALAGAHVVAQVGAPERAAGLVELGAAEIVHDLDGLEPVHAVVDNVGGPMLAAAVSALAVDGLALAVGQAGGEPTTFDFEAERIRGGRRAVEVFTVGTFTDGVGPDIEALARLVAAGRLDPQIGWQGPWDRAAEAATALRERRVAGKAVLEVA
ncbi:zinc-binding dehydrogenase [Pseudonocardia sp. CA-107938]|uniref:zinc-binding dehydrogenase n=1 Tax=Pseudonocardia sp. CA-107938 TaxID=3240021 RepID=UPI003D9340C4